MKSNASVILLAVLLTFPLVHFAGPSHQKEDINKPLRVGVIGLVHTHVHWILGREDRGDIELVGIVEPNRDLAKKYSEMHGYSMDIVFSSMEEMIEKAEPEAVTAFNTIYGHLEVVEYCAPRGIDVMVEKPLAVSIEHALKMEALATEYGIELLTNYETSWYGSIHKAHEMVKKGAIGKVRRIVFNTGHPGPIEIGCNDEFLEWLTDPELNGGGALTDFGCYGANIATWFVDGQQPEAVTCVTRQLKPDIYPKVEDEATIILSYADLQVHINASWNWSHNRKDMTIYGTEGFIECINGSEMRILLDEEEGEFEQEAPELDDEVNDPFAFLANKRRTPRNDPNGVSELPNNMTTMRILEAARISADRGTTVKWTELFK